MSQRTKSPWRVFVQKDIELPGVVMFGRYQLSASRSGLLPHSHRNAIEICFLERGEQTYRVGGFLHRLRGNDQFFTLPGEVHDTANLPQERGILYWVILKLGPSKRFLGLAEPMAARLKRELCRMPTRHFRAHPDSARILGEINDLFHEGQKRRDGLAPFRELRLQALLLQYLTRTIEASHRGVHGAATPLMQRLLRYIDEHVNEPVQRFAAGRGRAPFGVAVQGPVQTRSRRATSRVLAAEEDRAGDCVAQEPERDRGGL